MSFKSKLKDIEDQSRSYSIVGQILGRRGGDSGFAINSAQRDLSSQANDILDAENKRRQKEASIAAKAAAAKARKEQESQASAIRTKFGAENQQNSPVGPNLDQYATLPQDSDLPGYSTKPKPVTPSFGDSLKLPPVRKPEPPRPRAAERIDEIYSAPDWSKVPYQVDGEQWTPPDEGPITYDNSGAYRNAAVASNQRLSGQAGIGSLKDAPTGNYATGGGLPPIDNSSRATFVVSAYPYMLEAAGGDPNLAELMLAKAISENGDVGKGGGFIGNNFSGIKGTGSAGSFTADTWEQVNGQRVPQKGTFAAYTTPQEGFRAFMAFLENNSRYAAALARYKATGDSDTLFTDINRAGYASDQNWADTVRNIRDRQVRPLLR